FTCLRPDDMDPIIPQGLNVAPGGRMEPHARVHGRGHQNRLVSREEHCSGKVVRVAASHLCQQACSRRGDHDEVRLSAQPDMADIVLVLTVEQLGEDAITRDGADSQRCDELLSGGRHDCPHTRPALSQASDEVETFVGGNATSEDQEYASAVHVRTIGGWSAHCNTPRRGCRSSSSKGLAQLCYAWAYVLHTCRIEEMQVRIVFDRDITQSEINTGTLFKFDAI